MKKIESEKGLAGQGDVKITFNCPENLKEVLASNKITEDNLVLDWVGHKIANNAATKIKQVFKKAAEEPGKLTDDDKSLIAKVLSGETLELMDFIGLVRTAKPILKQFDQVLALIEAGKLPAAASEKLGVTTVEELKAKYRPEPKGALVDLDGLLGE